MAALSNSLLLSKTSYSHSQSGTTNLFFTPRSLGKKSISQKPLTVQAAYGDGNRASSAGIFIGGFILGGLVVGTLGCVYAPQISRAITGENRKEIMKKVPKFIYDEEKSLEQRRKKLDAKIEQLNSALDSISGQLKRDDKPNGAASDSGEYEAVA